MSGSGLPFLEPDINNKMFLTRIARNFSKYTFTWILPSGEKLQTTAGFGESLLEVAQENDIEIEAACDGTCACSTCHVILEKELYDKLPELLPDEDDMLDLAAGLTSTSRLGC